MYSTVQVVALVFLCAIPVGFIGGLLFMAMMVNAGQADELNEKLAKRYMENQR